MTALHCRVCQGPVDERRGAVGLLPDGRATWIPFVEDLRTAAYRLEHLACFVAEQGVGALADLLHQHDQRVRQEREAMAMLRDVERRDHAVDERPSRPPAPTGPPVLLDVSERDAVG